MGKERSGEVKSILIFNFIIVRSCTLGIANDKYLVIVYSLLNYMTNIITLLWVFSMSYFEADIRGSQIYITTLKQPGWLANLH